MSHIVVTGVSRGLGLAMVERFIEQGHCLSGCARSAAAIERLTERYDRSHYFQAVDTADDRQVAQWAKRSLALLGPPDLLINNAAVITANAPLWQVPAEDFATLVDVNIKGVFHTIRHFLPAMIQAGRGIVVNFSSGWGRTTAPEVAPYCASKWAIEGLTQALAQELPPGLAAIPLNPGIINTEMLQQCFGEQAADYPDPQQWADKAVPFLLSLMASNNGQPLTVPL